MGCLLVSYSDCGPDLYPKLTATLTPLQVILATPYAAPALFPAPRAAASQSAALSELVAFLVHCGLLCDATGVPDTGLCV